MRSAIAILIVLVVVMGTVGVSARDATPLTGPIEAASTTLFMSDPGSLIFDDKLDKYGLIIMFGVPSGSAFDWPIAVYNGTGETIEDLRLKVYEWYDDERHPFDDGAWILPMTIKPGEFGFGGASLHLGDKFLPGGPTKGIDAVLTGRPIAPADNAVEIVDVTITSAESSPSGTVSGVIRNDNPEDVKKIEIHRLCIEDSGVMTQVFNQILDQRLLSSGASTDFRVGMDPCDGTYVVASIAQKV